MYKLILKDYNEYDEESFFYESRNEYTSEEFFGIILEAIHTTSEIMESNDKLMGKRYNIYNIVISEEFSKELKKYDILYPIEADSLEKKYGDFYEFLGGVKAFYPLSLNEFIIENSSEKKLIRFDVSNGLIFDLSVDNL